MLKTVVVILAIAVLGIIAWKFQSTKSISLPSILGSPTAVVPALSGDIASNINQGNSPLNLPAGFTLSVFADKLVNPRVMTFDPMGNLLTSITSQGKVLALIDKNKTGKATAITVVEGLDKPHGLVFYCKEKCQLYVAETGGVSVFDYDQATFKATNKRRIVELPANGQHFTRSLMVLPSSTQDKLLIALGSDCNVCDETDWRRAKILSANMDGSDLKVFASGLRNSVAMTINPTTKKIFATDNGRDLLGDNLPPDEVNLIEEGKDYGWPICYGKNNHDIDFDKKQYFADPCREKTPSFIDLPAHSAPLGLAFIPDSWPDGYRGNLLVTFHGSWNRSVPRGYKIAMFKFDESGNLADGDNFTEFINGWLVKKDSTWNVLGRPVSILFSKTGEMFVTDDTAGVIYRIVPNKK